MIKTKSLINLSFIAASLAVVASNNAFAAGTPAATIINNTATMSYEISGTTQTNITTTATAFNVDELIDLTLTWQDGAPVSVNSPDVNDALTYLLTNTGNGQEAFLLTRNNTIAGDNYNPLNGSIGSVYLENGLSAGFQATGPNADTLYIAGVNNPDLAPDASQIIYVISNTPNTLSNGNTGRVQLQAASTTAGAPNSTPGTTLAGLGTSGVDAVVGGNSAQAQTIGSYIVSGLSVNVSKTATCSPAPLDCSAAATNTVVNYQLQINLTGAGIANNLVITDPLPANLTYVPNSIKVGSTAKTDAADADNSQFSSNTISVNLGNPVAPASFVITFSATIQ
jgi:uncharacterized repeat protein (TIGR01451 family)